MKNTGYAAKSTLISSTAVVLNIVLNAVFIFGLFHIPAMGIAGAAFATVIARAVEMIWAVIDSLKPNRIRLKIRYFLHTDRILSKTYWKHSLPIIGNELAWGVGFTMYSVVMGHMGSDAVAANSIANIAKNLLICFCIGIANGGSIIVGNELGAGRLNEAREYGGKLCRVAVISCEYDYDWRNIYSRRRYAFWAYLRYGNLMVRHRSHWRFCSICTALAGTASLFSVKLR